MPTNGEIAVTAEEVRDVEKRLADLEGPRAGARERELRRRPLGGRRRATALVDVGAAVIEFASALADTIGRTRAEVSSALETFQAADEGVSSAIDVRGEG